MKRNIRQHQSGVIAVLAAFCAILIVATTLSVIALGQLVFDVNEAQNTADAYSMSYAYQLLTQNFNANWPSTIDQNIATNGMPNIQTSANAGAAQKCSAVQNANFSTNYIPTTNGYNMACVQSIMTGSDSFLTSIWPQSWYNSQPTNNAVTQPTSNWSYGIVSQYQINNANIVAPRVIVLLDVSPTMSLPTTFNAPQTAMQYAINMFTTYLSTSAAQSINWGFIPFADCYASQYGNSPAGYNCPASLIAPLPVENTNTTSLSTQVNTVAQAAENLWNNANPNNYGSNTSLGKTDLAWAIAEALLMLNGSSPTTSGENVLQSLVNPYTPFLVNPMGIIIITDGIPDNADAITSQFESTGCQSYKPGSSLAVDNVGADDCTKKMASYALNNNVLIATIFVNRKNNYYAGITSADDPNVFLNSISSPAPSGNGNISFAATKNAVELQSVLNSFGFLTHCIATMPTPQSPLSWLTLPNQNNVNNSTLYAYWLDQQILPNSEMTISPVTGVDQLDCLTSFQFPATITSESQLGCFAQNINYMFVENYNNTSNPAFLLDAGRCALFNQGSTLQPVMRVRWGYPRLWNGIK